MTTSAVTLELPRTHERPAVLAWSVATVLTVTLLVAGQAGAIAPSVLACAAAFLFVAVASDVRAHRVPNLVTLPALFGALLASPWLGGAGGPVAALVGAALGFLLLVGPYAVGGMGAGDVKALMALGAWLGPETTLGATAWALLAAGSFGIVLLAARGELGDFARRWLRTGIALLTTRRLAYEPPAPGSSAAGGIPFAVALAVGLAAQWAGGTPW